MQLFGHRFINNQSFYHVLNIDAIQNTPPSSTLYLQFSEDNLDIIEHLRANYLSFALSVTTITELIYASSLQASYIIVPKELAKNAQDIANNYLFDAKILVLIDDNDEIEEFALLGIDGALLRNAIIKVNS
jgi:hypothetical protein